MLFVESTKTERIDELAVCAAQKKWGGRGDNKQVIFLHGLNTAMNNFSFAS